MIFVKRIPILLGSLALLITLVSCNGHSPTDPGEARSASLSGTVRDPHGNVWGGVGIGLVEPDGGVTADAVTDDEGRYSILALRPGKYLVWLQLGGTGPGYSVGEVEVHEGHTVFDIVSH
jgi:hypothetical protein